RPPGGAGASSAGECHLRHCLVGRHAAPDSAEGRLARERRLPRETERALRADRVPQELLLRALGDQRAEDRLRHQPGEWLLAGPPADALAELRHSVWRAEERLLPHRQRVLESAPPADARAELRVGVLSCECCDQRLRREAELLLTRPLAERLAVLRQRVSERALRRKGCGERLCRELLSILDGQRSERALERVLGSELL